MVMEYDYMVIGCAHMKMGLQHITMGYNYDDDLMYKHTPTIRCSGSTY